MDSVYVLIPIIGTIMFFSTVIFVVWASVHAKNRKATLQAEVQTRLIDKFSNAPEFVDFLNSDTGKQFLTGVDKMPQLMARDRIVGGVSRGVIMMLLGAAFIGLGIGFFISTLISLKMSQKFGLIGNDTPTPREIVNHKLDRRDATETQA